MNEIYYCRRVYKIRNEDIRKGDVGYIEEENLPEIISRQRFLLSDVRGWKQYIEANGNPYFHNKEEKMEVEFRDLRNIIIIGKLEDFDKVMEQYISSKQQFNFN